MAVVASASPALAAPTIEPPSDHDFGSHRVLDTAPGSTATNVFTITNTGTGQDLVISSILIGGANAADFTITVPPPTLTLPSNASVNLTVQFNPSTAGARVASLDIASNDATTPIASVALTGTGTNALISVPDVAFPIVGNGTTTSRNIAVANIGGMPQGLLHVTSASITGPVGSWFTFGPNGSSNCAGLTTCTFSGGGFDVPPTTNVGVRCSPPANAIGMQTATVTFTSDSDMGGDDTAELTCEAGRADIAIITPAPPDPLDFGDVFINPMTPPSLTATIRNNGNQNLVFTAAKSGMAALTARYTLGGCFSACTVMPGTMQQFTVAFNPNAPTNPNANISIDITSNDPDNATVSIPITARGIAPDISPSATALALGNVELAKTSAIQTLTVTNNGTAPLTITNASFTSGAADYVAMTGTTGTQMTMVPMGDSVSWDIVCTPTAQGARPGTFRIASNSFMEATVDVGLTCTGQQGLLVVIGSPINFGPHPVGTVDTRNFMLRNTGNLPVTGIAAVVDPADKGYSIDASTPVPAMLAAGASVTLTARFAPVATTDGGPATITFTGNWGTTPTQTTAVLTLAGVAQSVGFALTPNMIDFGNLRFDTTQTRTFCIQNTGQAAVTIQSISITPAMGTMSNEFTFSNIRRQTTCGMGGTSVTLPETLSNTTDAVQVTVTADPANRIGAMGATLTVTSDLAPPNTTRTLSLAGNSTTGAVTVTPASTIDFGPVDVQGTAVSQMFTITNTGDGPLDLGSFARTNDPEFTITLPAGTTILQPTLSLTIPITYKPVVASPAATPETVTITHSIVGVHNNMMGGTLIVRGRGIDRNLNLLASPLFPDTFRNPGDQAPVRGAQVQNTGEALLKVSAVMVTTATDVWQLVDPAPVDILPGTTHEFQVKFSPRRAGRAPDAKLLLVNDDDQRPMFEIPLTGNGLDRNVQFGPDTIRLGFTGVGVPVTSDNVLVLINIDSQNNFRINRIELDEGPFTIDGTTTDVPLTATETRSFNVTFTPESQGEFSVKARLFLDMDPESQHEITIEGTAVFVDAHGGGGCSIGGAIGGAGGSAGGAAGGVAIALAALLGRRRRRGLACAAAASTLALALALVLAPATASADNIVLSVFDPVPATTSNGFQLQSPDVGASGDWVASAVGSLATDPLILNGIANGASAGDHAVISRSYLVNVGGAVAFLGRFEAGARLPIYMQDGQAFGDPQTMFTTNPASGSATGDLTLHGKARLWRKPLEGKGAFVGGAGVQLTLPTSTDGQFTGVDSPSVRALLLTSLVPGAFENRIALSANLGGIFRARSTYANLEQKSGVAWGLGLTVRALDSLWVASEVYGDMVPSGRTDEMQQARALSPIEWLAGVRWQPDHRITVGLAAGRGLTSAVGTPGFRGVLALTYAPGAPDLRPIIPPKIDGDADADGVLDSVDRCPGEPEDRDLYDDTDGCPDLDNDGDAIADAQDKCPLEPEDKDGVDDADGCVDKDNDGDGIPDTLDKCAMQPEDKDGFQDTDGCLDDDNDHDGILDAADQCLNAPETINGLQDDDGCPDKGDSAIVLGTDRLEFLDSIQFTANHKVAKASTNLLAQVGATLRAHTEIVRLRITVHTQPTDDEAKDQEITDKRAAAVREWLVQWGVDAKRLEARGFGGKKPMIAPDRKGSAALNQRVELIILERK